MTLAALLAGAFGIAATATGLLRRYAIARRVLDVPNDRSSHVVPTPRGGGLGIVVAFIFGLLVLVTAGRLPLQTALAFGGPGLLVAVIGFVDDHVSVSIRLRLVVHFTAAAWGLFALGGIPPLPLFGGILNPGPAGNVLAVLGLVWLLNLYNFMDGIDGIAGLEAITTCLGAVVVSSLAGRPVSDATLPALLGVASLGFLLWNYPPARIFMGDAGSGFVGLLLGLLAIAAGQSVPEMVWSWLILLAVFITDATVTLFRRVIRRAPLHLAHRSHAYQHATSRVGRHGPVALATAAINLVWLLPLAILVGTKSIEPTIAMAVAYAPVVWLAFRYKAGAEAEELLHV
jgi:Fuc2NAc and GlcNAc transferase